MDMASSDDESPTSQELDEAILIEVPVSSVRKIIVGKEVDQDDSENSEHDGEGSPTDKSSEVQTEILNAKNPSPSRSSSGSDHSTLTINRQNLFDNVIRKSLVSSPHRIVRAYKRRAILKHLPQHISKLMRPTPAADSAITVKLVPTEHKESEANSSSSIGNKLVKCGITFKKLPASPKTPQPNKTAHLASTSGAHKPAQDNTNVASTSRSQPSFRPKVRIVNSKPETVSYVIPQDLLMSQTDKIGRKILKKTIQPSSKSLDEPINPDEFQTIEAEVEVEVKKTDDPQSKSRRKATLVPKSLADEMSFEEKPFTISSRPKANIDLIENLALYRVLVQQLMVKLKMPKFELGEDGDEYINTYKILRN